MKELPQARNFSRINDQIFGWFIIYMIVINMKELIGERIEKNSESRKIQKQIITIK